MCGMGRPGEGVAPCYGRTCNRATGRTKPRCRGVGVAEVGGKRVQFGVALSDGGHLLRQEVVMSEPLSPEQEAKAQELAARIEARSADAILEMARRLVAATDDTLFGDTEFALRDSAQ